MGGKMRILKILALFFIIAAAPAFAGAWLQPQGQGLFITQASYFSSNHYYDRGGQLQSQPTYTKYEIQPYAEYGLRENLTIGGTAFLQRDSQGALINNGLADPSIFARTRLWHDARQVLSIEPLLKFSSAFENTNPPRGGSTSYDAQLSILYGRSLHLVSPRDYLDVNVGYRARSGSLNNQLHGDLALGLEVMPGLQFIPAIRSIGSTNMPANAPFRQDGDQDYDLLKAELGAVYHLSDAQAVGITAFDVVDGSQTGDGAGVTISFSQQF